MTIRYARVETIARFLTSTALFPHQHGPGPKVNLKYNVPIRSEATSGEFERWEWLEDASGWAGNSSWSIYMYQECHVALASLPSHVTAPSRGPTAKVTQLLTAYLESNQLELSNDVILLRYS